MQCLWRKRVFSFLATLLAVLLLPATSWAADPPNKNIAATVNGAEITLAEVEREAKRVSEKRQVDEKDRPLLLAATLSKLVDRALVQEYLAEKKLAAKPAEVDVALERADKQLAQQKIPLDEHLAQLGVTRELFRRELEWQIGWSRYLERNLTDENLKRYFEKHRAHYDGGRRRVAHILFKAAWIFCVADRTSSLVSQVIQTERLLQLFIKIELI